MRDTAIRVLHVDDDPEFADLTADVLEREDHRITVETATSAREGLDRLAADEFDCVVSDYDMPGQTGIEFLKTVRERQADLPFILYTGKGSEEVASEAISAGATDYLQKRSGTEQYELLANRIDNAVTQSRAERAERRLLELAAHTDRILYIFNHDWSELLFVNAAYEDIWGRSIDTVREDPTDFLNGVHPDDRGRVQAAMERVSAGESLQLEFRVNNGDDGRWVRARGEPIRDETGDVVRVAGFVDEITEQKQRERELQRNERRFAAMFNDPNILVGLVDPDGTVLDINDTAMAYIDAAVDDVTGDPFWETPWFTGDEALQAELQQLIGRAASGEYVEFVFDHSEAVDDDLVVSCVFRPVRDADGDVVSLLISGRDITDRKRRDRDLRYQRSVLESVVETVPHGILVVDDDREFFTYNRSFVDMWGIPNDIVETGDDERALESVLDTLERPEAFLEQVEYFYAHPEEHSRDLIALTDGRTFERYTAPATDDDGTYYGRIWVFRDITDRLERERELEEYQTVVEAAPDPIAVVDADGRFEYVNRALCDVTGHDEETLLGGHFSLIKPEPEVERAETALQELLGGNAATTVRSEARLETADGEPRIYDDHMAVLSDNDESRRAVVIHRDVTDRVVRENELERKNERLSEYSDLLTHDVRNPLRVVEGRLELALETGDTDHIEAAMPALERLEDLIDDLGTVMQSGTAIDGEMEPIAIETLVERVWETIGVNRSATLTIEGSPEIMGDPAAVRRMLDNLLGNAIEHGGEGTTVRVGALDDGFYVEDDGPGIPEADRERVFEPGYSTKEADDGTGLGLTSVRQIVTAHQWDIRVREAESLNGVRFEITGAQRPEE